MTEFLISVYISATASVDVTAETNSLTDSADRKYAIPSGAKINIPYQINNDERGAEAPAEIFSGGGKRRVHHLLDKKKNLTGTTATRILRKELNQKLTSPS